MSWGARRIVAFGLLMMFVVLGPAGLGGAAGVVSPKTSCARVCPCESDALHDDDPSHECWDAEALMPEARGDHASVGAHPPSSACSEDCAQCGCCRSPVFALPVVPVKERWITTGFVNVLPPTAAPPSRAVAGVFRPPRALPST